MPDAIDHDVTTVPTDVVATLSLTVGKTYYGMNLSTVATVFGRTKADQPAVTERAYRYESGAEFEFSVETDEKIWLWTDDSGGCPIILNEV